MENTRNNKKQRGGNQRQRTKGQSARGRSTKSSGGQRSQGRRGGAQRGGGQRRGRPQNVQRGKVTSRCYEGIIQVTPGQTGFVTIEGFEDDVVVEHAYLKTALHGDRVEVCLFPQIPDDRIYGEVQRVIKRAKTQFVGVVKRPEPNAQFGILIPDDKRMYANILVSPLDAAVREDDKVLVKLESWEHHQQDPLGSIVRVIGRKGEIDTEMHAIVYDHGMEVDFPPAVTQQAHDIVRRADAIMQRELQTRQDMRGMTTFTIDPFDAKDFDDALSFRRINDEEFELGVHIADVTAYVELNSPMDLEAQQRAFTLYLVDRTIPMLPEELSNDLCSLRPGEDKLAYSAVLTMNDKGQVKKAWFGRTVIHSDHRFVYEDAQTVIDAREGRFADELLLLNSVAKKLRHARLERGAIDFDNPEVSFTLDERGHPIDVHVKERLDAHKLIEEFMILANHEVAKYIGKPKGEANLKAAKPCVYRVHDHPEKTRVGEFLAIIRDLGYSVKLQNGTIPAQEMNRLLASVTGEPEEAMIKTLALRTMPKAAYSTQNIGHYGLALDYYAHFTSPIRRYADMMVHRMLTTRLGGKEIAGDEKRWYTQMSQQVSLTEIDVQQAQYDSIALKQAEYMLDHADEVHEGVITGIKQFGIFIQVTKSQASGLVHISDLADDYYELDRTMHALIGKRKHKRYALGDTVKVKVSGGSAEEKQVNFVLVEGK